EAVLGHFNDIDHEEDNIDVTYENAQARERTQVLMDIANDENALVVGTGDLSEIALGWCTYNADHMSMYNVNSTIPKTLVRQILSVYAEKADSIIRDIIYDVLDTPVSPELLPADENGEIAQKTEEKIGSYDLNDFFLYNMIYLGLAPSKTFRLACIAFEEKAEPEQIYEALERFIKRFFSQQFKRSCSPDGIQVTDVSLSPRGAFKMASDMSAKAYLEELSANA
ncbi:MAG: NAD(+) synthase, partial [Clostridia bacterium]|nr:NAD(+) synthase [Clostridia bacterium]